MARPPVIGLAVTTIGRPAIARLLKSAASSTQPPAVAVIANQSGRALDIDPASYPFPVLVVASDGGASVGRNDAVRNMSRLVDVLGFPNDDSYYAPTALEAIAARFAVEDPPSALACSFAVPDYRGQSDLPADGAPLDRRSVWRAIEWGIFVTRREFDAVGGFRTDLGTGGPTPWQSGEGTDLLLRIMDRGGSVLSARSIEVFGPGERRDLSDDEFVAKHRRYARGTGRVYRLHRYPILVRLRILVAPVAGMRRLDDSRRLSARLAMARLLGRLEGLLGRCFDVFAR